jgi:hypothetical protein
LKYIPKNTREDILFEQSERKFIEYRKTIIWCPFDTEESNFVKLLRQE